jgi:molybdopterin synthase catalytic subunit
VTLITYEPISAGKIMEEENFPHCGAVVSFEGRVRNHHQGRQVERLFYEAYIPMAEKVLKALMEESKQEWPDCLLKARHRIGSLEVGEVAVIVVVWSPHRKEAFRACETMIDRIKHCLPIWKKETYKDGSVAWVGCEAHESTNL